MAPKKPNFYPVILAGGRGTRFWPLSRRRRAKQVLALDGDRTMIQQTVDRLLPLSSKDRFWIVTNDDLRPIIRKQLKQLDKEQILAEPAGRNTAPAIGLAAFILERTDPDAVLGLFPSDHVIADDRRFRKTIAQAVELAAAGENIVVLGIEPTRPETGYGYVEAGDAMEKGVRRVRRFTEKPDVERALQFLNAGNYFWNSGMFVWSAHTLTAALREHLPKTAEILERIAKHWDTKKFDKAFAKLYPKVENISVDYAVLEPRSAKGEGASNIFAIPADFGWSDLGSWTALYEHETGPRKSGDKDGNVLFAAGSNTLAAAGNYVYAPGKFVAAVGVRNLVVVETEDALLITTREQSQDVGKVVKWLDEMKMKKLT